MEEKSKFVEMPCPVCGKYMFVDDTDLEKEDPDYEGKCDDFCVECGWQYDLNQTNDPDLKNGKNMMSLNEYKAWYMSKVEENPNYSYLEEAFQHLICVLYVASMNSQIKSLGKSVRCVDG